MNKLKTKKITLSQALLLYIVMVYTPIIRFVTKGTINMAHQSAWLTYIASLVFFVPLLFVLYKITKKFEGQSFHDILCRILGKPAGKTIAVVYLVWLMILLSLYIRYAIEKLVSSTYVGTDMTIISFFAVILIGIVLRYGIKVLARMNKVIFALGIVQLIIILVFLFPNISFENLTPITLPDIGPIFESSIYVMTISVYITFIFIFNDQIEYGEKPFRKFSFATIFLFAMTTLILIATIGMFGWELAGKLTFPFLSAVRNIEIFDLSAGFESLFISIWMLAEFITMSVFVYCIVRLIKNIFHLDSQTPALTAVVGFGFFFSIFICNTIFELVQFSESVAVVGNLVLGFAVPLAVFIIGKARKLL